MERQLQSLSCRELERIMWRLRDWPFLQAEIVRVMALKNCPAPKRRWLIW